MVEPIFHGLGATIEVHLVLTPEEFQRATPAVEQAVQKYS
jgi:hypothetical protein